MNFSMLEEINEALWSGDIDWLHEHYGCKCCCYQHTFGSGCPAYQWGGCRGYGAEEFREQEEAWEKVYADMGRDLYTGLMICRCGQPWITETGYDGWDRCINCGSS